MVTGRPVNHEAAKPLARFIGEQLTERLRELLEQKHLYQSVVLDLEVETTSVEKRIAAAAIRHSGTTVIDEQLHELFRGDVRQMLNGEWFPDEDAPQRVTAYGDEETEGQVLFASPYVRLYCQSRECKQIQPFVPVRSTALIGREDARGYSRGGHTEIHYAEDNTGAFQTFALLYRCSGCRKAPEAFVIRRVGMKLTLCGRSPMEFVPVPPHLPESMHRFYRSAVIAHQSGETLPANFLLRTLIEQWVQERHQSPSADAALNTYMASLEDDFKRRFPSLKSLYAILSSDIHQATGSEAVFARARDEIDLHFEGLKLFRRLGPASGPDDLLPKGCS